MKRFKTVLQFLATGTLTMLLSACYGAVEMIMPMYGVPYSRRTILLRTVDSATKAPVQAISVSYRYLPAGTWQSFGSGATDRYGEASQALYLDSTDEIAIRVVDVDGPLNGGTYAEQSVVVDVDTATATEVLQLTRTGN